jgi:hypothetical protein
VVVAVVAAAMHGMATPVPSLGIAVPVIAPALTTAVVAILLGRDHAAPLAYVSRSIGTLIGADFLNLGNIGALGAPIASNRAQEHSMASFSPVSSRCCWRASTRRLNARRFQKTEHVWGLSHE